MPSIYKESDKFSLHLTNRGPEPNDYDMGFTTNTLDNVSSGLYRATATALDGWEFVSLECGGNGSYGYTTYEFVVSEDGKTATYEDFKLGKNGLSSATFKLTGTVMREATKPLPDYLGFNHVYLMTPQQLIDFTKERFVGGTSENQIDLGQYIINILELPFKIDKTLLGSIMNIVVGNVNMTTQGTEILNDELKIDVGNIVIPSTYNNGYDYTSTNVLLHLPYARTVELPLEYTINQTINVEYIINLYTGDTTLNLRSSKINDVIFYSSTFKLGRNIPFINNTGSQEVIGTQQPTTPVNNGVYTAFIEVVRNKPHGLDNPFNETTSEEVMLGDVKGYVSVDDIELKNVATLKEYEYIKSILKEGVLIK